MELREAEMHVGVEFRGAPRLEGPIPASVGPEEPPCPVTILDGRGALTNTRESVR